MAFLALPFLPIFEEDGYTPETLVVAFWVVAVMFPITIIFSAKYCPQGENRSAHGKTSVFHAFKALLWNKPLRNFTLIFVLLGLSMGLQTGIAFLYITSFLGLFEQAPIIFIASFPLALVGLPIWLWISKTIGKHYGMAIGTLLTSFAFLGLVLLKPGPNLFISFLILNSVIHLLQSSWVSIGPSMLGDIIDYDQSMTGEDNSGTYYAFFTFMRKLFEGIGAGAGLYIAAIFGFDPANFIMNDSVIFSMHLLMGYLPAGLLITASIVSLYAPITLARHKKILSDINEAKNNSAEVSASV